MSAERKQEKLELREKLKEEVRLELIEKEKLKDEIKKEIQKEEAGFSGIISVLITFGMLFGALLLAGEIGVYILCFIGTMWMTFDSKGKDLKSIDSFWCAKSSVGWFFYGLFLFIAAFPSYLTFVYKKK